MWIKIVLAWMISGCPSIRKNILLSVLLRDRMSKIVWKYLQIMHWGEKSQRLMGYMVNKSYFVLSVKKFSKFPRLRNSTRIWVSAMAVATLDRICPCECPSVPPFVDVWHIFIDLLNIRLFRHLFLEGWETLL